MKKITMMILILMFFSFTIYAQAKNEGAYQVITGIFGIKAEFASETDLHNYCLELAKDKNFYSLIVVMVNRSDYGILFTYISNAADAKDKVRNYLNKAYEKFGGVDKCRAMENWGAYSITENDNPIVVLKEFQK